MSPIEQARTQIRDAVTRISDTTAKLLAANGLKAPTPLPPGAPPSREEMREAAERLHALSRRLASA